MNDKPSHLTFKILKNAFREFCVKTKQNFSQHFQRFLLNLFLMLNNRKMKVFFDQKDSQI